MRDLAVILGGADCLWDDVRALMNLADPRDATVIAVNDAGIAWPMRLDHWVTMHPNELEARQDARRRAGRPGGYETWSSPERGPGADHYLTGWDEGSSGFLAVGVALEGVGLDRVVLCGTPLDARPHFNRDGSWDGHETYRGAWREGLPDLEGRVTSMSGWTRELLGAPTAAWIRHGTLDRSGSARVN